MQGLILMLWGHYSRNLIKQVRTPPGRKTQPGVSAPSRWPAAADCLTR